MDYGKRLKRIRKQLGLTQASLAQAIGLKSKQTISDIETGKQKRLAYAYEEKLADRFGVDIRWLNSGEGEAFVTDETRVEEGKTYYGNRIALPLFSAEEAILAQTQSYRHRRVTPLLFERHYLETLGGRHMSSLFAVEFPDNKGLYLILPYRCEKVIVEGAPYLLVYKRTLLIRKVKYGMQEDMLRLYENDGESGSIPMHSDAFRPIGRVIARFDVY